jgi:transcriptional regulator with AAA-type ATPase domain
VCTEVQDHLAAATGTVVLRHLEALAAATARSLDEILAAGAAPSVRLVATLSVARGADVPDGLPVLERFAATIHAPPLRKRPEDVADLVPALVRRHAGDAPVRCSREVIQVLMRADWPGNVRQLESLLKTMLARRQVGELTLRDLPPEYLQLPDRRLTAMQHAQRAAILHALERTDGNKSQAAMLVGISRVTIYRKLKELGITEP